MTEKQPSYGVAAHPGYSPAARDIAKGIVDPMVRIETVEMHTGGEPVRIIAAGYPTILGETLLDKRRDAQTRLDAYRRFVMWEPRGHFDMYGVLPVPPDDPAAEMAVLFIHNEGYSTMCGHATIALGRYAVDQGLVQMENGIGRLNLQCPCGLVEVTMRTAYDAAGRERPGSVSFISVPAFAFALDCRVEVPGLGSVTLDIGYGGAYYAFLPASRFNLDVRRSPTRDLVAAATAVSDAVRAQVILDHPESADLAFLYGTILTDGADAYDAETPSANICVFAEREVDRSPTGSGVTARIALQMARGQIELGQLRRFESVTGSEFTARAVAELRYGRFSAVRVEVTGQAYYTGRSLFTVEADDPLAGGFLLR
ncbi:MAG TPA: proline racemase family protein [Dongiaceae bacterium]